ncbi:RNA processing FACTOR [Rhynchospora pubera]|uniref:RNA processing FACTOR n=1 Tax=Rhynchospora pubera TaxID=906938 RepID=A0AAV8FT58_9POAL|nr:RNA processing FACTOR [Rhynchospora pubera]
MSVKAAKPFSGRLQSLVKKRCHAEKLQLEEDISCFHCVLDDHPPSIIAINAHLASIAKSKHPLRYPTVLALFNRFKLTSARDRTRVSPTIHTFGLALYCCCRMHRTDLGFCVLGQSLRHGCGANTIIFNSLIKGLCTANNIRDAANLLAKMPLMGCAPNLITYTTLIDCLQYARARPVSSDGKRTELL